MLKPAKTSPQAMRLFAEQVARLGTLSNKMSAYVASVPPGTPGTTAVPEYVDAWLEESKRLRATVQGWVDRYQASLAEIAPRELERIKQRFDRGDKAAILDAVYECVQAQVPLPHWACVAFLNAYHKVRGAHHASWDEVFGIPHKKHEKLPAKRQERELKWKVFRAVSELRAERPRKDHFSTVAKKFNISVGLCKEYFYAANKLAQYPHEKVRRALQRFVEVDGALEEVSVAVSTNFQNK
jgi:hypothetical protein